MNDERDFGAVSLRHLEKLIALRCDAIEKQADATAASNEKAMKIAAAELAKRLKILNHAHDRAVEVQATYLPREVFLGVMRETDNRISNVEKSIARLMAVIAFLAFAIPIAIYFIRNGAGP